MLASNASSLSICSNANALQFWHLRISKVFKKPEYYIGQTVLHKMRVQQGEILHPVTVIGMYWNGFSWCYAVELPEDHPEFEIENHQWDFMDYFQLEPM